jgi:hypothetical protein
MNYCSLDEAWNLPQKKKSSSCNTFINHLKECEKCSNKIKKNFKEYFYSNMGIEDNYGMDYSKVNKEIKRNKKRNKIIETFSTINNDNNNNNNINQSDNIIDIIILIIFGILLIYIMDSLVKLGKKIKEN